MHIKKIYFLSISILLFLTVSCKKSTDSVTPSTSVVVGSWKLDRVILTELPTDYSSINGKNLDPLVNFGLQSVYTISSDNTFTDKETQSGIITDYKGSWTYTSNVITLTYSDNSTDSFTYDETTKQLSTAALPLTLTMTNPNTQLSENVSGKYQLVYVKQ